MNYSDTIVELLYLIGTIFFIYGIKRMSHPDTARSGNFVGAVGMIIGILTILFAPFDYSNNVILIYAIILIAIILGSVIGVYASIKVKLTAMPEMVSLFNGFGGGCSMLIGYTELYKFVGSSVTNNPLLVLTGIFAVFVGAITLIGSIVAWGKLSGFLRDVIKLPFPQFINFVLLIGIIIVGYFIMTTTVLSASFIGMLILVSCIYGFTFVTPIGGGDMPVVISLLNSFSGIAATISGFLYNNTFMIVGGLLVGASGTILTILMCRAMNRSLINVLIGGLGATSLSVDGDENKVVREITFSDLSVQLKYSSRVMIVPGYGLAVAQAQHACHELEKQLEAEGVQVSYAIHPVAGRMPGHMNVLLAESQVSYEKLLELEPANEQFTSTDVILVIGANDVVNPAAKENPGSPIYGMPILDVEQAKTVVVFKRSMRTGYAGVDNPLFYRENTRMLFGDAKDSLSKLKNEVINV